MFMNCSGTDIYYEVHGEGQVLLAIHGFGVDMNIMKSCLEPLFTEKERFKRIYIDLPGMGKTKNDEQVCSADDMLDVLMEFIDKVIGSETFCLVGESYGGYLSRGLIAKLGSSQIEKAAFICPVIFPEQTDRDLPQKNIMVADEVFLTGLSKENRIAFQQENVLLTERVYCRWQSDVKTGLDAGRQKILDTILKHYGFGSWYRETQYSGEVLWLFGKQDHVVGYRDVFLIENHYPYSTIVIINKAGHYLQYEQQEMFEFHMKNWLGLE